MSNYYEKALTKEPFKAKDAEHPVVPIYGPERANIVKIGKDIRVTCEPTGKSVIIALSRFEKMPEVKRTNPEGEEFLCTYVTFKDQLPYGPEPEMTEKEDNETHNSDVGEVLNKLEDFVEDLREEGEQDLRIILWYIRKLRKEQF